MKIKNSSVVPTSKLREYIRFAKPSGVGKVHGIIVSPSKHACMTGKAFRTGVIYLKVGDGMFSRHYPRKRHEWKRVYLYGDGTRRTVSKGYLPCVYLDAEEEMVHVVAHELRHLWQRKHTRGKVWGSRGRYSERDADAYGIRKMREWRRAKRSPDACMDASFTALAYT